VVDHIPEQAFQRSASGRERNFKILGRRRCVADAEWLTYISMFPT